MSLVLRAFPPGHRATYAAEMVEASDSDLHAGDLRAPSSVNPDGLVELLVTTSGPLRARTGAEAIDTWSCPDFVDVRDAHTGMATTAWTIDEVLTHGSSKSRLNSQIRPTG